MNLVEFLERQQTWSEQTFGAEPRGYSVIAHIETELEEVRAKPDDLHEWIDIVLLAFDGARRQGFTPAQIAAALEHKQDVNEKRSWSKPNAAGVIHHTGG